jgi:hypothetical protein
MLAKKVILCILFALLFVKCKDENNQVVNGKKLYELNCLQCHNTYKSVLHETTLEKMSTIDSVHLVTIIKELTNDSIHEKYLINFSSNNIAELIAYIKSYKQPKFPLP